MKSKHYLPILLAFTILLGCKKEQQGPMAPQAMPLAVSKVVRKTVVTYNSYPTSIEGIINSDVRPKVTGYIQKVFIDEGQKVKAGQLLFKLETQSLSQDAAAAKAAVNAAQVEVDRLIPLVEKNIISNVQLETQKAKLLQAQSNYNSIVANVDYANIKSPVDGYVGAINLREGNLASPSDPTPLTTVTDISKVYAFFSMNEADYANFIQNTPGATLQEKIKNFPKVNLILPNGKTYDQQGTIETVTGQVDKKTGTVSFRATFDNPAGVITNGNSGMIQIPQTFENALVVPLESTFEQQGQTFVFTLDSENKAMPTKIDVVNTQGNLALLTGGLNEGDTFIASGVGKLRRGTPIQPNEVPFDSVSKPIKTLFR